MGCRNESAFFVCHSLPELLDLSWLGWGGNSRSSLDTFRQVRSIGSETRVTRQLGMENQCSNGRPRTMLQEFRRRISAAIYGKGIAPTNLHQSPGFEQVVQGPQGSRLFLGPPKGLLLSFLEGVVVLHWRVGALQRVRGLHWRGPGTLREVERHGRSSVMSESDTAGKPIGMGEAP